MKKDWQDRLTDDVTAKLKKDGWYYTNIGYRFHASKREDGSFAEIWDLEKVKKNVKR